ncbi:MAG: FAD-dependent oxidoreductase [Candidatus Buchananbacteria bacterium]
MVYDVIIIGAGPAGMSAGIYCCRKRLTTLILAKDIGGQTAKSWEVENYLGYSLISGADLANKFKEHLDNFKCTESKIGFEIKKLTQSKELFTVQSLDGITYQSKTVIIASGKKPRELGLVEEKKFWGRGITYCATCDAPLFKDKVVAVIGGGDAALDAAYQLAKIATKVYLLIKDEKIKENVDKVLLAKVSELEKVEILYQAIATKVFGEKFVSGLEYQNQKTKEIKNIDLQGIFVEIGSIPNVDFCRGLVKLNKKDELIIDEHNMTSAAGIFAAGDVTDVIEKQTIIAAGEGAKAAIAVANYLSRLKN